MSDKKHNSPASRRARAKGAFVEHIDKRKLWTDYQGICGLCMQPVKFARMTIDHIKPLSLGGLHEYANVQPAHSLCNHIKGSGEFSLERLEEAIRKRNKRRSKRYRNTTGRKGVPLQPAIRAL
jgi:5-methylcytosine-specific restriction endonuclease McrA